MHWHKYTWTHLDIRYLMSSSLICYINKSKFKDHKDIDESKFKDYKDIY